MRTYSLSPRGKKRDKRGDRPEPIAVCELLTKAETVTTPKRRKDEQANATTPRPRANSRQGKRPDGRLAQSHDSVQPEVPLQGRE